MTKRGVYVAAPFDEAPRVRVIHLALLDADMDPTSSWAMTASGPEDFSQFVPHQLREFAEQNSVDIRDSDAMIALAYPGKGGEMFCELAIALSWGKPVYYVGARRVLSAYRRGVVICESAEQAIQRLARS